MGTLTLYRLVYGSSGAVSLGESSDRAWLQGEADRLNEQAPGYNHRVEPVQPVKGKGK